MLFLKNNVTPWEKIVEIWGKTFNYRQAFLKNKDNSIQKYLDEFTAVKYPLQGFELVHIDF